MHEDASQTSGQARESQEQITERKHESLFAAQDLPGSFPVPPASAAGQGNTFRRIVLPLLAFIGLIVVITWISQYLPSWRVGTETKSALPPTGKPTIVFYNVKPITEPKANDDAPVEMVPTDKSRQVIALWEPRFPIYAVEFESENTGCYDFLFVNESDQPAEIGLERQSCACSKIQVCLMPASRAKDHVVQRHKKGVWNKVPAEADEADYGWKDLPVDAVVGTVVAPGQGGLMRLIWSGDRVKESKQLDFLVWTQPLGQERERRPFELYARVALVAPIQFLPAKILDLGEISADGSAEREFWCWSSTRKHFDVGFPDNPLNPLIQCKAEPLTAAELHNLTEKMIAGDLKSRPWSGYKVHVLAKEKAGTNQLDMGLLYKQLAMTAKLSNNLMEPVAAPYLRALVAADVRVGNSKSVAFDLETFVAKNPVVNRKFKLFTDKGVKLKYLTAQPTVLSASLKELPDLGTDKKESAWELTLTVPANIFNGQLENSFLLFDYTSAAGKTRQLRIPVTGTAKTSSGPF